MQILNLSYGGHTATDPIPSALGHLTQLEVLDLSRNNLTGEVPSELGELMISLISANVSFDHLTGSLPPAWVMFLLSDPATFRGNPGLCLQYNANNVCATRPSEGAGAKLRLAARVIVGVVLGAVLAFVVLVGLEIFVAFRFWRSGHVQEEMPVEPAAEKEQSEMSNLTSQHSRLRTS